jgi:hypothetical protein
MQVRLSAGHPVCMHLCTETRCTQLQRMFQNASPYTKIMVLSLDPVNSIQWQSSEIPEIEWI